MTRIAAPQVWISTTSRADQPRDSAGSAGFKAVCMCRYTAAVLRSCGPALGQATMQYAAHPVSFWQLRDPSDGFVHGLVSAELDKQLPNADVVITSPYYPGAGKISCTRGCTLPVGEHFHSHRTLIALTLA